MYGCICAADPSEIGLLCVFNRGVNNYLLLIFIICVFTKYVWANPLKDKKAKPHFLMVSLE